MGQSTGRMCVCFINLKRVCNCYYWFDLQYGVYTHMGLCLDLLFPSRWVFIILLYRGGSIRSFAHSKASTRVTPMANVSRSTLLSMDHVNPGTTSIVQFAVPRHCTW